MILYKDGDTKYLNLKKSTATRNRTTWRGLCYKRAFKNIGAFLIND